MGAILDRILRAKGKEAVDLPRLGLGKVVRTKGVIPSSEFRRIDALPWRPVPDEAELEEMADLVTEWLKTPTGTERLWGIQAWALLEIADNRGLIGGLGVSSGKTRIGMLAPTVLELERPVYIPPSAHKDKSDRAYRALKPHWRLHPGLEIVGYDDLSNPRWLDWLEKYRPDGVIFDEAHNIKDDESARGLRFDRFWQQFHPVVVCLSGTFYRRSPKDLQVLGNWALNDGSPVPRTYKECEDWASALDPKSRKPLGPGALATWCKEGDSVHEGFGRRLTQVPGVVFHSKAVDVSLSITTKVIQFEECEPHFERLRTYWEKPDDWRINDAPARWAHSRMLGFGYYNHYDPYPPEDWSDARRWMNRLVTYLIRVSQTQRWAAAGGPRIDAELAAFNWCEANPDELADIVMTKQLGDTVHKMCGDEIFATWVAIAPTWDETASPVWFSDAQIKRAAAWGKRHKGLIWTPYKEFGYELARLTGWSYYGAKDRATDGAGRSIMDATPGEPAIASVDSVGEGFDLQDLWATNLYPCPMSSGQEWQQTLARTHRYGQRADQVSAEVWFSCIEHYASFLGAIAEEEKTAEATRAVDRRLVVADISLPHHNDMLKLATHARWSTKTRVPDE